MIASPPGKSGNHRAIGSVTASLPSPASCRTAVPIIVLVTLPMRKGSSGDRAAPVARSALPLAAT